MPEVRSLAKIDILIHQLKKLSQDERILLGLYFYEKLTVEEIGAVLHREPSAVVQILKRILPHLHVKQESLSDQQNLMSEIFG